MAKRTKKLPMRLIVSIVAVLLVAVAIPMSTAFADGMNGMIGGGEKKTFTTEDGRGFYYTSDPTKTPVQYTYKSEGGSDIVIYPQIFTADVIGEEYNQFVITTDETPDFTSHFGQIRVAFDISPSQIIEKGTTKFVLTLSSTSDQKIRVIYGFQNVYLEKETSPIFENIEFVGVGTTNKYVTIPLEVSCNDESMMDTDESGNVYVNINAGETVEIIYTWDKNDMIRAVAALQDYNVKYMTINVRGVASDPISDGESYSINLFGYADPVNGYAISNIFVGILGVGLIVGAVFATPWVGRGTFDDIRKRRSRRKSQRRR